MKAPFPFHILPVWALGMMAFACSQGVEEKEFLARFKELSDKRLEFRKNMKALGDSSYAHRHFAQETLQEAMADTVLDRVFAPGYAAYNDSLRKELRQGLGYFQVQYIKNKPLVGTWERTEMRHNDLVEQIKSGDLSEKEGLDSLVAIQQRLSGLIHLSDSLVKTSTARYWEFRKTMDEYRYNLKNLKVLYAEDIHRLRNAAN